MIGDLLSLGQLRIARVMDGMLRRERRQCVYECGGPLIPSKGGVKCVPFHG